MCSLATLSPGGVALIARARRGVILATGGLSHGGPLRARYVPAAAGTLTAAVSPGNASSGAVLAQRVGAALSAPTKEGALWVPVSTFTRPDGSHGTYPHTVADRAKPGLIAVDGTGRRFVNEALSYDEFVRARLRGAPATVPAWLLCDRDFLWKYGLGPREAVRPVSGASRTGRISSTRIHGRGACRRGRGCDRRAGGYREELQSPRPRGP